MLHEDFMQDKQPPKFESFYPDYLEAKMNLSKSSMREDADDFMIRADSNERSEDDQQFTPVLPNRFSENQ